LFEMKFLADVNVEKPIVDFFGENNYDIKWIPDYDCQMSDKDLLKMANAEGRILITNDKDFGELTFLQKQVSVGIILIRITGQDVTKKLKMINTLLLKYKEKLFNNFIVITEKKIRIIPLEGAR